MLADPGHQRVGEQARPAVERQQHAHHGEAHAQLGMVERQHGVDQSVAEQAEPDDGARQGDGAAADDGRAGGGHGQPARSTSASRNAAAQIAAPRRAPCSSIGRAQEAVQHAAELDEVGERAFLLQAPGIGAALVAQRVVARGHDQCRRQAGQRLGAQRRDPPVLARRLVGRVVVEEPFHGRRIQSVAVVVETVGFRPRHGVRHRVGQHLQLELGAVVVARPDRGGGREIATGAVAADRQPARIDADLPAVGGHPLQAGDDIVERAGEAGLGRQPIVDGEDHDAGLDRELRAEHVVAVEIAEHPAAAVGEDQARQLGVAERRDRPVDTHLDRTGRAGNVAVDDGDAIGPRTLRAGAGREILLARRFGAERDPRRPVGRRHEVQESLGFGIECHEHSLAAPAPVSSRAEC